MVEKIEQGNVNQIGRAAPSILTQDQRIQELEKLLVEEKARRIEAELKIKAIVIALENAQSLDQIHQVKWRLIAVDGILSNNPDFFDHWENQVQMIERRSSIKP